MRRRKLGSRSSPADGSLHPITGAGSGGRRTIAWGGRRGARRQAVSDGGGAGRGGASARLKGIRVRGGGARAQGGPARVAEMAGGAAAAAPAAPTTSAGASRKRKRTFSSLR
jgi:hypothetical protein